jgi:DUSP domain
MIKDFIYDESNDIQYYINIDWAIDYTSFLDGHDLTPMPPIDNYVLLEDKVDEEQNDKKERKRSFRIRGNLVENENFVLVNEKTWIFILKLYDGGPSIKLRRSGTLIVSDKNEEILFSTKLQQKSTEGLVVIFLIKNLG